MLEDRIRQQIPGRVEHEVVPLLRKQKGFLD